MKRYLKVAVLLLMMVFGLSFSINEAEAKKVYRTETVTVPVSVPAQTLSDAPVYNKDTVTRKQISSKDVTVPKGTIVTVIGEKKTVTDNKTEKWFKVSFPVGKKTYKGYIINTNIELKNTEEAAAKIIDAGDGTKVKINPGKKKSLTSDGVIVTVKNSDKVNIVSETTVNGNKWYKISFEFNGKSVTGYLKVKFVMLTKTKKEERIYALTEAQFEEELKKQGVPEEYKQYLRILHDQYPFWEFRMYETGLEWDTVIKNESVVGRNLIPNSKSAAWKSKDPKAYDEKTGKWKVFDGSTWVAASKEAVAYYMDPRNFLNERTIYQFETQEYQKGIHTKSGVEKVISNTPFSGKKFSYVDPLTGKNAKMTYASAFMTAAENTKVSPIHLASRVKQEVVTSTTTTSEAVTGKNKTYPGIYNFYNIGAYSGKNPMLNGLKWASEGKDYLRPWTDPYRSIVGGAMYIGSKYINIGQNTVYLEKFNVTPKDRYTHQYMTNVEAATSEAAKIKKAYEESGLLEKTPLVFSIPVYKNMPADPCAAPK